MGKPAGAKAKASGALPQDQGAAKPVIEAEPAGAAKPAGKAGGAGKTGGAGGAKAGRSGAPDTAGSGNAAAKAARARAAAKSVDPSARPRGAGPQFGTVPFALKRHVSPHGQVTAVSMMKDEGPYVLEWVAHHLAIGFTDLVVYTNDCSDGTDDMLIRLEELGLAHHRRNDIPEGIRPQPSALNYAQDEPVVGLSDWVMVFDADEFLSIRYGDGSLDGLIAAAKAQGANGIVVTWRIFGAGGVVDWSRAPVTEQYLQAAPQDWNKGWGVKTLFQFDPDAWKLGIHRPKLKTRVIKTDFPDRVKWLNGSGREMEEYFKFRGWRSITRTVGYDWVQLNHYAVKSVDSYALRKLRGNVNNKKDKYNSDYWSLQDRNEIRDDTMLRYTDRRDAILTALKQDPVLLSLHEAALARVETRLAEIRATQAYSDLVADLARASAVPITQIVAKPPQARDPEKIAALMSDVEKLRNAEAKAERKAAGPRGPVALVGSGLYADPVRLEGDFSGAWVDNHGIGLPVDPRIFSASAVAAVAKGKFDRGLARLMPQEAPQSVHLLEIGAGIGFLGLHLARARPDLRLTLQEDDPGLSAAMAAIMAVNRMEFGAKLQRETRSLGPSGEGLAAILDLRPEVLVLSDPRLDPDTLPALLADLGPDLPVQLLLHGRLAERHRAKAEAVKTALATLGYGVNPRFDANQTWAFQRVKP